MSQSQRAVHYSILSYLQSLNTESPTDDLETAVSLLSTHFDISLSSVENFKELSYYPTTLPTIFELGVNSLQLQPFAKVSTDFEGDPVFQAYHSTVVSKGYFNGVEENSVQYLERYSKLLQKYKERTTAPPEKSKAEKEALAEEKKVQGNVALSGKEYESAIQSYTEALDLSPSGPNSHIYYCNRAAAYCYLNEYNDAVADCEAAINLAPDYVKAYSRLGLAYYHLGNFEKSVEVYTKADKLEPNNEASKKSLAKAIKKLEETRKGASAMSTGGKGGGTSAGSGGGLPDLSAMMSDPNLGGMMNSPFMKDAMNKMGGQEGMANLMKDPKMMAMAQKMMQDPAALQQAMSMLGGAGGGGMPDLSSMAGLMGGAGKAGKKKGQFKGFEDDN